MSSWLMTIDRRRRVAQRFSAGLGDRGDLDIGEILDREIAQLLDRLRARRARRQESDAENHSQESAAPPRATPIPPERRALCAPANCRPRHASPPTTMPARTGFFPRRSRAIAIPPPPLQRRQTLLKPFRSRQRARSPNWGGARGGAPAIAPSPEYSNDPPFIATRSSRGKRGARGTPLPTLPLKGGGEREEACASRFLPLPP